MSSGKRLCDSSRAPSGFCRKMLWNMNIHSSDQSKTTTTGALRIQPPLIVLRIEAARQGKRSEMKFAVKVNSVHLTSSPLSNVDIKLFLVSFSKVVQRYRYGRPAIVLWIKKDRGKTYNHFYSIRRPNKISYLCCAITFLNRNKIFILDKMCRKLYFSSQTKWPGLQNFLVSTGKREDITHARDEWTTSSE